MTVIPSPSEWGHKAACLGMDSDLFFRSNQSKPIRDDLENMCNSCCVKHKCLEWAVHHENHGWWAGTSAHKRAQIRRERGISASRPEMMTAYSRKD
jgi:hypothetical protein